MNDIEKKEEGRSFLDSLDINKFLFDLLDKCLISKNFRNGDVFVCGRFDDEDEDAVHKKHMWVLHEFLRLLAISRWSKYSRGSLTGRNQ